MVALTITLTVLLLGYVGWDPNHFQKPNPGLYQAEDTTPKDTIPPTTISLSPLPAATHTDSALLPTPSPTPTPPPSIIITPPITITVTWYDYGDANPKTACGDRLNPDSFTAAAPISWHLPCFHPVIICTHSACVRTIVNDRIPAASSSRYHELILDATPAVMQALSIPFGRTATGTAYGRATVQVGACRRTPSLP
jgi:hypothetical protein